MSRKCALISWCASVRLVSFNIKGPFFSPTNICKDISRYIYRYIYRYIERDIYLNLSWAHPQVHIQKVESGSTVLGPTTFCRRGGLS